MLTWYSANLTSCICGGSSLTTFHNWHIESWMEEGVIAANETRYLIHRPKLRNESQSSTMCEEFTMNRLAHLTPDPVRLLASEDWFYSGLWPTTCQSTIGTTNTIHAGIIKVVQSILTEKYYEENAIHIILNATGILELGGSKWLARLRRYDNWAKWFGRIQNKAVHYCDAQQVQICLISCPGGEAQYTWQSAFLVVSLWNKDTQLWPLPVMNI